MERQRQPVIISETTAPRCPMCGSGEWMHNPDEAPNDYCGQCGTPLDWKHAYNEDTEETVDLTKEE